MYRAVRNRVIDWAQSWSLNPLLILRRLRLCGTRKQSVDDTPWCLESLLLLVLTTAWINRHELQPAASNCYQRSCPKRAPHTSRVGDAQYTKRGCFLRTRPVNGFERRLMKLFLTYHSWLLLVCI